ncbi:MAG: hypothetical protein DVB32_08735 [Verrucomicrobia bacterium]|nr:MAG: hypothetical protein DVB32_08735 [Verrucomicrobiota bacterium]
MKMHLFRELAAKAALLLVMTAIPGEIALAQAPQFTPGKLAVLQLGDGGTARGAVPSDIWASRQTPYFIDQFDPNGVNQTTPSFQVAIPTNGPNSLWVNGNAGTEGNMTLSADKSVLTLGGYCGDICSIFPTALPTPPLAPSNLSYDRGIGSVDAFGNYVNVYRGASWYGIAQGKTNPRGVTADGSGNFWGCGNGYGSLYFNANTGDSPIQVQNIVLTSCSKIINGALYDSVKSGESAGLPPGIYSRVHFDLSPFPLPNLASFPQLEIPVHPLYQNCIGFDINPQGNVAYVADNKAGIQKYVKTGQSWKLAYNLSVPGYTNWTTGTIVDPNSTANMVGCFSVAVDWSGANPVVFATTADSPGFDPRDAKKSSMVYYGNRVIRINDTNTVATGENIIATTGILTTVVQAPVPDPALNKNYVVYKSVTFTPDLRPNIVSQPESRSVVAGDSVTFTVGASSKYNLTYQWFKGEDTLSPEITATLALNAVDLAADGSTYRCVVSNNYGSVTSSIVTLSVTSVATLPAIASVQRITNYVGNNFTITAHLGGTDPKSGFQWYTNGVALTDAGEFSGVNTSTLHIINASTNAAAIYSISALNVAGPATLDVADLTVAYAAPLFVQPPSGMTTFIGRNPSFTASVSGYLLTNTWYFSTKTNLTGTTLTPVTLGGRYAQTDVSGQPALTTLDVTGAIALDATNLVLVVKNPSGSITSAPVSLKLVVQPSSHTFVSYTAAGQLYSQDFDTLPTPGGGSFEAANGQNMTYVMTNFVGIATNIVFAAANASVEINYSLDNPVDFGYPVIPNGKIGGFGLSKKMSGWYGYSEKPLLFAATSGDQSAAGLIDNGQNYNNLNGLTTTTTNRALGLLTSSRSGTIAFGIALVNNSSATLNRINLGFTGELWRNNPIQQPLAFGVLVDPNGTASAFPTNEVNSSSLTYVDSLTLKFPTSLGTEVYDGTLPVNQSNLSAAGLTIPDWAPGSTLWLVWQSSTAAGGAQNVAIDNVSFSAGVVAAPAVAVEPSAQITPVSAKLLATVNPNSGDTTTHFEYGTSAQYGSVTSDSNVASGISPVSTSAVLSGLLPGTSYHFRVVAMNSLGTTYGADSTFVTAPLPRPTLGLMSYNIGGFHFSFTSLAGLSFSALATSDPTLPLNQWQNLGHPVETSAGHYQFTDAAALNGAQQFYILSQP